MKIYAVFLIILLIILQFKLWFDEGGYFHNLGLEEELAIIREENAKLKARNQELARQIILVKEDMGKVEALARRNLGMIKEGERFMFIIKDEQSNNSHPEQANQSDNHEQ